MKSKYSILLGFLALLNLFPCVSGADLGNHVRSGPHEVYHEVHGDSENVVFFGHSMGFAVAEVIAVKYPTLCAGLGSLDGAHFEVPEDLKEKE
jgi:pimeloyl-ACP methyl ester carboxylesterase